MQLIIIVSAGTYILCLIAFTTAIAIVTTSSIIVVARMYTCIVTYFIY